MEVETEATVKGQVVCPQCGHVFEAEVTGETTITVDYDNYGEED